MRAVTFQAPGEVLVEQVPEPELQHPEDAIVSVEASGICGSDLHIYHGRTPVERGFTVGHEFVGTVLAVGDDVERAAVGDRVLGCFHSACGTCVACVRGDYHRCLLGRTFGHGSKLGDLQGAQAERLLVPRANLTLRRVPDGMSSDTALFAGDVMGTGYHAIAHAGTRRATRWPCWDSDRWGCAPCRPPARPGRCRCSRSTPWHPGSRWPSRSARRPSISPRRSPSASCAPPRRVAVSTWSWTPSAIRARWSWRSASRETPAPSWGSAPTRGAARSQSAWPG